MGDLIAGPSKVAYPLWLGLTLLVVVGCSGQSPDPTPKQSKAPAIDSPSANGEPAQTVPQPSTPQPSMTQPASPAEKSVPPEPEVASSESSTTEASMTQPSTTEPSNSGSSTTQSSSSAKESDSGGAEEGSEGDTEEEEEDDEGFEDELSAELDKEFADKETEEVYDPLSGYNRAMTTFNDTVYTYALDPAARGLRFVLPEYSRRGLANFFHNLLYPVRLINNLLQAKFANSGEETVRFVTNTTIGVLGLWDPADKWFGLEAHNEDFGQTLGYWGVGSGPHVVLPFLGPSNARDMFGLVPDYFLDPSSRLDDGETQIALRVFKEVNYTSLHIGEYENLKRDALDLYPFLRDVYEQNRAQKILE